MSHVSRRPFLRRICLFVNMHCCALNNNFPRWIIFLTRMSFYILGMAGSPTVYTFLGGPVSPSKIPEQRITDPATHVYLSTR